MLKNKSIYGSKTERETPDRMQVRGRVRSQHGSYIIGKAENASAFCSAALTVDASRSLVSQTSEVGQVILQEQG